MCLLFFHHHNMNKTSCKLKWKRRTEESAKLKCKQPASSHSPNNASTSCGQTGKAPVQHLWSHKNTQKCIYKQFCLLFYKKSFKRNQNKLDLWPLTFSCSDNALWVQWEISVLPARRVGFALRRLSGKHGRPQLRALQGWLLPAGGGTELLALPLQPYRWVQVSQNPYVWKMLDVQTREQRWEDQFKCP